MVNQVAFAVVGADVTITMAPEPGQLQLRLRAGHGARAAANISWMAGAFQRLSEPCVRNIEVNAEHPSAISVASVGLVTALTPRLGYAEIAKAALAGGGSIRHLVLASRRLTSEELDDLLSPERLSGS